MRRSWIRYASVTAILYGVFLIALAPTAWVAWGVSRMSDGAVTLSDARGTLWSGDATLTISADQRSLGRVRWRINPAWLFGGQIAANFDLSGPDTTLSVKLRTGFGGARITYATGRFSAALAAVFYAPLSIAGPTGNIELRANNVSLTRSVVDGDVNLLWRGAAVNMSNVRPLGDYELRLSGKNRTVDIALLTRGGPLNLVGKGNWLPFDGGLVEFSGVARANGQQPELAPLLAMLGAQDAGEARLWLRTALVLR